MAALAGQSAFLAEQDQPSSLVVDDCSGVLVSDFNSLPPYLERQFGVPPKGLLVLSIVSWCEPGCNVFRLIYWRMQIPCEGSLCFYPALST